MSFGLESRIRFFLVNERTRPISQEQTVWRKCKTGSLRASFRPTLDSLSQRRVSTSHLVTVTQVLAVG